MSAENDAEARDMIRTLRVAIPDIERIPCDFIEDLDDVPRQLTNPDGEYVIYFPWTEADAAWDWVLLVWDRVRYSARQALDDGHLHVVIRRGVDLVPD